jgi:hypothetical protein
VSIRLLLDENLSELLPPLLSEQFPDSRHVRLLGLGGADDLAIWELSKFESFLLVTKDEDFLLLDHAEAIKAFTTHPEAGFLLLSPGAKVNRDVSGALPEAEGGASAATAARPSARRSSAGKARKRRQGSVTEPFVCLAVELRGWRISDSPERDGIGPCMQSACAANSVVFRLAHPRHPCRSATCRERVLP